MSLVLMPWIHSLHTLGRASSPLLTMQDNRMLPWMEVLLVLLLRNLLLPVLHISLLRLLLQVHRQILVLSWPHEVFLVLPLVRTVLRMQVLLLRIPFHRTGLPWLPDKSETYLKLHRMDSLQDTFHRIHIYHNQLLLFRSRQMWWLSYHRLLHKDVPEQ